MHIKTILLAASALLAFSAPVMAATILIDKDQVTLPVPGKPAVTNYSSTGSIGTHPGNGGVKSPLCDPMPNAYQAYFEFCKQRIFPVSLSERSTGQVAKVTAAVPGVPAQCVYTYATTSGPWWNPTITFSQTTGAC